MKLARAFFQAIVLSGCSSLVFADADRDAVMQWSAACAARSRVELQWLRTHDVVDSRGQLTDSFDTTESAVYEYPTSMLVRTRAVPTGDPQADRLRSVRVDLDSEISPENGWVERQVALGSERDLGNEHLLRDVVRSEAVRAPMLLGMWIHEHPEKVRRIAREGERLVGEVPELNIRFTLQPGRGDDPATGWVTQIDIVDASGQPRAWWKYDEPRQVEGASYQVGGIRTQYSIQRDGKLFEGVSDQLQLVRASGDRVDTGAPDAGQSTGTNTKPGSAADQGDRSPRSASDRGWLRTSIVTATLIVAVAGVFLLIRQRARSS